MSVVAPAKERAVGALITAGVLWGTGGLAGSFLTAQGNLHPLAVAGCRLLFGGVCAVLYLVVTGQLRAVPRGRAVLVRLLVVGVLLAVFQVSYFASVALTSVSLATMTTIGSVPVFVAVATTVRDRRLPAPATLAAVVIALAGLVLLTSSSDGAVTGARLFGGLACALAAGAGFAVLTLVNGKPVAGLEPLPTIAFGCLAGGVLLVPLSLGSALSADWRPEVVAVALFLAVCPTAVAYAAYFRGLRTAHPVVAALAALLEPLVAALLAALLLGERLGVTGWCGAALLVGALGVASVRQQRA
ncbi:DMT family transporter [Amycolatopsis sp. 195334CR]|uniref:DMT family transporter n=1 Tax=Amycolatopsis sp. 195334CR TaxID=2814588 RepID=UPI001A8C179D|nr:DMT family transporter [Amycolatopsis sp. 195334CR]MBN6041646.1 DMT family transporter [Amycolatopsis sp. 195334CR]